MMVKSWEVKGNKMDKADVKEKKEEEKEKD